MKNCWFFDNNFNGVSDEILGDVVEFFDFPLDDDVETDVVEQDWNDQFKHIEEPSLGVFSVPSFDLCGQTQNEKPNLVNNFSASELSDIDRRNIVNSSLKERRGLLPKTAGAKYGKTIPIQNFSFKGTNLLQCQTYSPVSVFESSSYSSVENSNFELPLIPAKRPRSKRRRLSSFNKLFLIQFIPPFQKHQSKTQRAGKQKRKDISQRRVQRKPTKKDNTSQRADDIKMKRSSLQESVTPRKCTHCEVTETPQWREGPKGPKTLCNACGVRYRSGRLFPEYRPAASPTFEASLHSNSHKKVIEIRNKVNNETDKGSSILYLSSNF
ncbi:unnamed protein product [Lathyrus oleraceus]|uniref:GATA-type domain-containing protein n=1 Tax=Pisum sativum TaxID=3888 RepID=A0A9D4VXA5_PEA|nr:GATA transcription factor 11-like [Pisum sativum]KAI5391188.1 hypothetical protein KIW84_076157 [Pisum sativum]